MYYLNNSGPYTRQQCIAEISKFVMPLPLNGFSHGGVWKRTALILELFDQYQLSTLHIEVCGYYFTIGLTPCNTSATSHQHWHTPSPHQGALFS